MFLPPPLGYNAFTLAEVLITLVIIGVIAALTVPTLIAKYQKEQTVTRLKKAYSTLSQTTNRAIADYGPISTWDMFADNNTNDTKKFLNKYVIPYLVVMTKPSTSAEGGWDTRNNKCLNNQVCSTTNNTVKFTLADGTQIYAIGRYYANDSVVLFMDVDINGDKKPNMFGKDIFELTYRLKFPYVWLNNTYHMTYPEGSLDGKFLPEGFWFTRQQLVTSTNSSCECKRGSLGTHCLALIMKDGWQIRDDYPW